MRLCIRGRLQYSYPDDGQYAANYRRRRQPRPVAANNVQPAAERRQRSGQRGSSVLQRSPGCLHSGRLSQRLAIGRPLGRGIAAERQGPRVDFAGVVCIGRVSRRRDRGPCRLGLGRRPATGPICTRYYNDADKYTEQLRKLEKTVADVPNSAPGHFLLGYHYLMTGAKEEAKKHFAQAAKLTPNDKLAEHILKQLESGDTVTPPDLPKPPPATKRESAVDKINRNGGPTAPAELVASPTITHRTRPPRLRIDAPWSMFSAAASTQPTLSHLHQPIAAIRRANQQHHALGERLVLHCLMNSAAERTGFLSTCMTSMPLRMPARAARPSGSTSLTSAPLNPL